MKNEGISLNRINSNPLEHRFAVAWEELNTDEVGHLNGRGTLDYMLSPTNRPDGEVAERDRVVAATVIQWLGSPVGQRFLKLE